MHPSLLKGFCRRFGCVLLLLALFGCAAEGVGTTATGTAAAETDAERVMRVADDVRRRGDLTSAMVLYRRAQALEPEAPGPLIALGDGFRQLRRYDEARQAYRRALQLDQGNIDALLGHALLLIETGNAERAAEILSPVAVDGARDPRLRNARGIAYDMLGKHDAAQQEYKAGLERQPDDALLRNNLALSLALQDRYDDAAAVLEDLLKGRQATSRYRQNLALIHGLAGRTEQAVELGRIDMTEAEVRSNLAYYARLRAMPAEERRKALLHSLVEASPPNGSPGVSR